MVDEPTEILASTPAERATPSGATPRPAVPTRALAPDELARALIGRTLGRFAITSRLGRGGSSEVFLAEQKQLGRSAVIKVLRAPLDAGARVERFLREAKLASRLDHPYAAHVYAFGAEDDGLLWIAMEHVRGATLDELIVRRGPIPPAIFAPLFHRLCEVVHTAHELGIVHRDIKGGNVMVIERAGQLLPKLLDFGIAKGVFPGDPRAATGTDLSGGHPDLASGDTGHGDAVATPITGHGTTLGSPHYMAPEQWEAPADVDARADIYALGVLAYRCAAGRLPFQDYPRPSLPAAHATLPPPPLPDRVPPRLAAAIARALAKDPDQRYPTAIAFGEAVQRAVGGAIPEVVPIFDPATRDRWLRAGPQPIADAIAHLAGAATTVEADAALADLVAILCRWLAVCALAALPNADERAATAAGATVDVAARLDLASEALRERARCVLGRDDGEPWLALARAAVAEVSSGHPLPGLVAALQPAERLAALVARIDDRDRVRSATTLASDVVAVADALGELEPLLAYALVVGLGDGVAESWQGPRRRDRERVVVWDEAASDPRPLGPHEVALLDGTGHVAVRLSPLVQIAAPLPAAEPELFLLWRSGRGAARLVAAPWGFELDDDAAGRWLAALTTEDDSTLHDADDAAAPYPGLAAYGADDAARFVGREREIEALANRLVRSPLVAVLGPSGAGKSSFVAAGVVPRLAEHYSVVTLRPGRHPMHALAALPSVGGDTEDAVALVARLRTLGERAPRGLVIVIDQFEELVTLCADPRERTRFAETLAAAADGPTSGVRVIVTLRDDFATALELEAALRGRFDVFVLAAPAPEALRRILVEPARRAQVTVDPRVVDDMVAEVAGRPASLPLLSFTAAQLWIARDRAQRRITHAAYAALGGVAGALSSYADQVYDSLARGDQEIARALFARLVAPDGTRIPAPRAELEQLTRAPRVLAHLVDARLLVVRADDRGDLVELVHECLAERWERLARWRREDAVDRALLADVHAAARRWHDGARAADRLWRGPALADLRRLADRAASPLTELERAFADAGTRAEQRARRVRRAVVAVAMLALAGVAATMTYLSHAADRSRADAVASERDARAAAALADERLTASQIAQGRRELNDGRGLAALAYFAEAMRRGADTPALRFMIAIAARALPAERLVVRDRHVTAVAFAGDEILVGDQDGHVRAFTRDGAPLVDLALGAGDVLAFDARAAPRVLVTAARAAIVLDLAAHAERARVPLARPIAARLGPGADEVTAVTRERVAIYALAHPDREVRGAPYDPDVSDTEPIFTAHTSALVLAAGTQIRRLDLATMTTRVLETETWDGPIASADGTTLAWMDHARAIHVVDADGRPRTAPFHAANAATQLTVSASGDRIAALGDRAIAIYRADGALVREVATEPSQTLVTIRGDDLWAATSIGLVRHYAGDDLVASFPSQVTELEDLRLDARGDRVATLGSDGTLVVLDGAVRHVELRPDVCARGAYKVSGVALGYQCEGATEITAYVGVHRVGTVEGEEILEATWEPTYARGLAVGATELAIFDADARPLARTRTRLGPAAFADADHVVVAAGGEHTPPGETGLWRWTYARADGAPDTWTKIVPDVKASAVARVAGGLLVAEERALVLRDAGTLAERHRVDAGERIEFLTATPDGRYAAATLAVGLTLVVDGATGAIVRTLAPADAIGFAATLDPTGALLLRAARGGLTVWDAATGDELLWSPELLRAGLVATFAPSGTIELAGRRPGVIAIAPERRPRSEILRVLDCRVPVAIVDGSRLAPRPPPPADCK